jgi:hypothetical protein
VEVVVPERIVRRRVERPDPLRLARESIQQQLR